MTINSERIVTRCPSCGNQTLFVGVDGHLMCSFLHCANPDVSHRINELLDVARKFDLIIALGKKYVASEMPEELRFERDE